MHGSRWRREETRPVGPARAAQPRRLSPTLPVPLGRGAVKTLDQDGVEVMSSSYAGVDWAFEKHDVVIADETGEEILAATFAHDEAGVRGGRYPTRDTLAADAGQAAVAVESGKRKAACFRWACNKRLRQAFVTLADTSRHHNPWAQDLYAAASARGHDVEPLNRLLISICTSKP